MTRSNRKLLTFIGLMLLVSLACTCGALSSVAGETPSPEVEFPTFPPDDSTDVFEATEAPDEAPTEPSDGGSFDTEFPVPDDAQNFTNLAGNVNFQTGLSLEEAMAFYRDAFTAQGYTERDLLTVTSDTTFSMVFDGHASGDAIVVQGVDLGGSSNVNVRLEAVP